jgi:hypothetical protein
MRLVIVFTEAGDFDFWGATKTARKPPFLDIR